MEEVANVVGVIGEVNAATEDDMEDGMEEMIVAGSVPAAVTGVATTEVGIASLLTTVVVSESVASDMVNE
jgi:hypothetical protein